MATGDAYAGGRGVGDDMEAIKRSPAFWAKLGHHPFWPAKMASLDERKRFSGYQRKATQVCVKFYGSNDIGWIHPSSLVKFDDGMRKNFHTNSKVHKNAKFIIGVEEAKRLWAEYQEYMGSSGEGTNGGAHGTSSTGWGGGRAASDPLLCLACNQPRGSDTSFVTCRACGSAYHGRCAAADSAADANGDASGRMCCQICNTGAHMTPNGPPSHGLPSLNRSWSGVGEGRGSEVEGDDGDVGNKRSRSNRSRGDGAELKKRRVASAAAAGIDRRYKWGHDAHAEWDGFGTAGDEQEWTCYICKEPGMLIQCDAPSCRKAYHKPCLSMSAWGQHYFCPRHRCVICHAPDSEASGLHSEGNGQGHSLWKCSQCPVAFCNKHLPPGYNDPDPLPPPPTTRVGRVSAAMARHIANNFQHEDTGPLCHHCRHPSPRLRLARILERSWARLATNYLALPFMRPFLNGVPRPTSTAPSSSLSAPTTPTDDTAAADTTSSPSTAAAAGSAGGASSETAPQTRPSGPTAMEVDTPNTQAASGDVSKPVKSSSTFTRTARAAPTPLGANAVASDAPDSWLDLVGIGTKVRTLAYRTVDEYLADLDVVAEQTTRVVSSCKDITLIEAMETLLGNAKRFIESVQKEAAAAEAMIKEEECAKARTAAAGLNSVAQNPQDGLVQWRAECEDRLSTTSVPEYCPAKTVDEWKDYLQRAPMLLAETQQPFLDQDDSDRIEIERSEIANIIASLRFEDRFAYKTTILQRDHLEAALEEQAKLLRRCVEGHAALRQAMADEKRVAIDFKAIARNLKQQRKLQESGGNDDATPVAPHAGGTATAAASANAQDPTRTHAPTTTTASTNAHDSARTRAASVTSGAEGDAVVGAGAQGPEAQDGMVGQAAHAPGGESRSNGDVEEKCDGDGSQDDEVEFDDSHSVVTLGDMHIIKELQIANQNLRARLEAKNNLLTQREMQLQASKRAFLNLQEQNARLKERVTQLESRGRRG